MYELTGNKTYFDYIQAGVDNIVFPNGTIHGDYKWVEQWTDSAGYLLNVIALLHFRRTRLGRCSAWVFLDFLTTLARTGPTFIYLYVVNALVVPCN